MVNIIIGLIALVLGVWGMVSNWWASIDLISTLLFVILFVYGVIAVLAGMKRFSKRSLNE